MPASTPLNHLPGASEGFTWNGAAVERDTLRAASRGMAEAGKVVQRQIMQNLNRPGTPTSKTGRSLLALGRSLLWKTLGNPVQRSLAMMKSKRNREAIAEAESIRDLGGLVDPPGGMPRRREGFLFRSIENLPGDAPTERHIGSNLRYAAAQEYGTLDGHLPARPYMRPSLEQSKGDAFEAFVKEAASSLAGRGG